MTTVLSWTSRSKIWDPAGELSRGEDEYIPRPGEDGVILGLPAWMGDAAVDRFVDACDTSLARGGLEGPEAKLGGDWGFAAAF